MVHIKAQTDVIGLVIIVVLVVIIALVALRFSLMNTSSTDVNTVLSIKANNLLNTIKKTSLCESTVSDAIIACCNYEEFCNKDSCDFVKEEINKIITGSVEEDYYFKAKTLENTCFELNENCNGITSSIFYLKNENGRAEIQVKLCPK